MSEKDRGRFAFPIPLGIEVDLEKKRSAAHILTVSNDSEMAQELIEKIAEELGAYEVESVDPSQENTHAFSSRSWNASWEPKGPTPPWMSKNDPEDQLL